MATQEEANKIIQDVLAARPGTSNAEAIIQDVLAGRPAAQVQETTPSRPPTADDLIQRLRTEIGTRGRMLLESPQFRRNVGQKFREGLGQVLTVGGGFAAPALAARTGLGLLSAEMLTSAGGVAAGQLVEGREEPSEIATAAVAPPVVRGGIAAIRGGIRLGARMLPGAPAAIQEEAIERGQSMVAGFRPQNLDTLTQQARVFDRIQVPLQDFQRTAQDLQQQAALLIPDLQPKMALRTIDQLNTIINQAGTSSLPLRQIIVNLQEIGAEVGRFRRATADHSGLVQGASRNLSAFRGIYRSLLEGIDNLPSPISDELQQLRQALRQDFGVTDLERIIESPGILVQRQIDGLVSINGRKLANAWNKGKDSQFIRESFTLEQQKQVDDWIEELIKLPVLPSPKGVNVGSALVLGRGALVGTAAGLVLDPATATALGGFAAGAPPLIARAIMTKPGRQFIRQLIKEGKPITPKVMETLATIAREALIETGLPAQGQEAVEGLLTQATPSAEPAGVLAGAEERRQQASAGIAPQIPLTR